MSLFRKLNSDQQLLLKDELDNAAYDVKQTHRRRQPELLADINASRDELDALLRERYQ